MSTAFFVARNQYSYLANQLINWWQQSGRKTLPWQINPSKYKTWISEIMLQQTQVATVEPYFVRFMERFPTVIELASSSVDEVLQLWSGLGYYARARNIHRSAQFIVNQHQGELPSDYDSLLTLPGIGPSTAGAILSLSGIEPKPILDGNVKRVLSRFFGVKGWPGEGKVSKELWDLSAKSLPADNFQIYTQGIMDLGATVCLPKNPNCHICPIISRCYAHQYHLVDEIPKKKPITKKRTESKYLLMLIFDGRSNTKDLFLEKRIGQSLWGGLWSLPEIELSEDPRSWCERHFTNTILSIDPWEPIKQPLSNYILYIHPVRIRMDGRLNYMHTSCHPRAFPKPKLNSGCFALTKTLEANFGFPGPVNRLVNQLTKQ